VILRVGCASIGVGVLWRRGGTIGPSIKVGAFVWVLLVSWRFLFCLGGMLAAVCWFLVVTPGPQGDSFPACLEGALPCFRPQCRYSTALHASNRFMGHPWPCERPKKDLVRVLYLALL